LHPPHIHRPNPQRLVLPQMTQQLPTPSPALPSRRSPACNSRSAGTWPWTCNPAVHPGAYRSSMRLTGMIWYRTLPSVFLRGGYATARPTYLVRLVSWAVLHLQESLHPILGQDRRHSPLQLPSCADWFLPRPGGGVKPRRAASASSAVAPGPWAALASGPRLGRMICTTLTPGVFGLTHQAGLRSLELVAHTNDFRLRPESATTCDAFSPVRAPPPRPRHLAAIPRHGTGSCRNPPWAAFSARVSKAAIFSRPRNHPGPAHHRCRTRRYSGRYNGRRRHCRDGTSRRPMNNPGRLGGPAAISFELGQVGTLSLLWPSCNQPARR